MRGLAASLEKKDFVQLELMISPKSSEQVVEAALSVQDLPSFRVNAKEGFKPTGENTVKWLNSECQTDFGDLTTYGCTIQHTEQRALKLSQLDTVLNHIQKRLKTETWIGQRPSQAAGFEDYELRSLDQINLYAACTYVIKPACSPLDSLPVDPQTCNRRPCSLVELLATDRVQPPDFFVSQ